MRRTLFLIAATLVVSTTALAAPFTITVPNRVTGTVLVPIGRVRMTLECAADVTGATLLVEEGASSKTFSLASGLQDFTNSNPSFLGPDPTNDQIRFRKDTGTPTRIHIELVLRHVLDDPANFCVLEDAVAPPASWTYTLTLSGATITGYRISSYGVGGLDIATIPTNCSKAPRRIASTPAFTNIETANPGVVNLGRHPHDIVLVLDNSGSMGRPTPGSPADTRMNVLKPVAQAFLGMWETEALTPGTAGGNNLTTDRLGLIFFSTDLTVPSAGADVGGLPTTTLTQRGAFAVPGAGHPWNPISTAIGAATPTNDTAIGKGLLGAINSLTASPNDTTIVLMTDGVQNVSPLIERVGVSPTGTLTLNGSDLRAYGIPILTIALGVGGDVDSELLDDVARQTAGRSRVPATSAAAASSFAGQLVATLLGNTLLVATEGEDSIAVGAATSTPVTVPLDGSIRRAVFALGWSTNLRGNLGLEITPPGSLQPVAPATLTSGPGWAVYGVGIPGTGPAGNWKIRALRSANTEGPLTAVPFHFGAYTYEGKLDFNGMFTAKEQRTGDDVVIKTEVSFGNVPVTTAEGHITLRVARPGESLGNLLHQMTVPQDVLTTPTPGDTTTPYDRKVNFLATKLAAAAAPAILPGTIPLHHEGNGLYSAHFSDTSEAGAYQFLLTYDFDAPDGSGRIHRIEQLERVIKVKPDVDATSVVMSPGPAPGTSVVRVTPKDKFGNYLGPGAPGRIQINVIGVGVVSAIADPNETGDYEATVSGVPSGTVPNVVVTVDEVSVPVKTAGPGGSSSAWGVFLDAGVNITHGDFSASGVDGKFSINLGLERLLNPSWSVEGILGYHAFDVPFVSNAHAWQLSANAKRWFAVSNPKWHPFLNAGAGNYRFDPGNTNKFGWNAGGGVLYDWSAACGIEGVYNYHAVNSGGVDGRWSTWQVGVRHRF
jgi:opacity protein-like surface antigen